MILTGSAAPGGSSTQVQYNSAGAFAGDSNFTWSASTGVALGKPITITGGTVTASTPVLTATQTWNDGSVTFTGLKLNVTNSASAAGSALAEFQIGSVAGIRLDARGGILLPAVSGTYPGFSTSPSGLFLVGGNSTGETLMAGPLKLTGSLQLRTADTLRWASDNVWDSTSTDLFVVRDAANTLAQRNGTMAQVARVYRTFTDSSNYERLALQTGSGYIELAAETAGTGTDDLDVKLTPAGVGRAKVGSNYIVDAASSTKTTAAAPYANDGYVTVNINGTAVKLMTTA